MGYINMYTCKCGYKKELNVGAGMNAINRNIISMRLPEELSAQFGREYEEGKVDTYMIDNMLSVCPKCKELKTVIHFRYRRTDGAAEEYAAPCDVCGGQVVPVDEDNVHCPRCNETMDWTQTGYWD